MEKKIEKVEPRTLPGFMELLPNEQILFNKMKETIQKTYEQYGFLPLDTPIIEDAKVLLAKAGGETEKQVYRFSKGDNDLALRFDLTVPLAKYVSQYYNKLSFPFKRYQIGKVYRGEKPQRGRYREFYQCDVDIIGDGELSILNDAEIPSIIYNTFKNLGFDEFTICINNRKILNGLFSSINLSDSSEEILRIIDKIEKIGSNEVKEQLLELVKDAEKVDTIMKFIQIEGDTESKLAQLDNLGITDETFLLGLEELKEVVKYIKLFNVPDNYYTVDLTIARGLDYYTGTVYETFLNKYRNLGSICSGGRYDNLAEFYTDKKLPGVGISIGLSRLFFQLEDNNIINANNETIADVMVVSIDNNNYETEIKIATNLRNAGINVQTITEDMKLKNKLKYANKLKIKYLIIVGEDEVKAGKVTLKDMITGEQKLVKFEDIINNIKK